MATRRTSRRGSFTRNITTLGLPETIRQLREMGEHVLQAAKDALKQGAAEVVADAKSRCPVKTGKLRDSIRADPDNAGTEYNISANAQNDNGEYYGQYVEFSPAINKPFLYPAMEANYDRIMSNIRSAVNRAAQTGHA